MSDDKKKRKIEGGESLKFNQGKIIGGESLRAYHYPELVTHNFTLKTMNQDGEEIPVNVETVEVKSKTRGTTVSGVFPTVSAKDWKGELPDHEEVKELLIEAYDKYTKKAQANKQVTIGGNYNIFIGDPQIIIVKDNSETNISITYNDIIKNITNYQGDLNTYHTQITDIIGEENIKELQKTLEVIEYSDPIRLGKYIDKLKNTETFKLLEKNASKLSPIIPWITNIINLAKEVNLPS